MAREFGDVGAATRHAGAAGDACDTFPAEQKQSVLRVAMGTWRRDVRMYEWCDRKVPSSFSARPKARSVSKISHSPAAGLNACHREAMR
jgi:hypothetical protein